MEMVDDEQQYDQVGGCDELNAAADGVSMSEGNDNASPCDNSNSIEADDTNLSTHHVEHLHCSTEAACSNTTAGDKTTSDSATDIEDTTDVDEAEPLHQCNENTQADSLEDTKSVEPTSKTEEGLEPSQVHETQADSATSEDDGWMYVLGHEQLKKRACIIIFSCCFL